jgi:peptide/nickel transport system permease protein
LISFVARRFLLALGIVIAASILVFGATQLLPGNAALAILGKSATPERIQQLNSQLHLNRSPVSQYVSWIKDLCTGNLGTSLASNTPVSAAISGRILDSSFLVMAAAVVGVPMGLAVGIASAASRKGRLDNVLSILTLSIAAVPEFVLALALTLCFGTLLLKVLPATANLAPGERPWNDLSGITLPVVTLALAIVPYIARITRAAMREALSSEYIEFGELRGLSRRHLLLRHALPNALAPSAQATAISLSYLAGGAVIVEYVFAYPGVGQGLVYAVQARDVPTIQALTVLLAAFYVFVNFLADVITVLLSPRVRTGLI